MIQGTSLNQEWLIKYFQSLKINLFGQDRIRISINRLASGKKEVSHRQVQRTQIDLLSGD